MDKKEQAMIIGHNVRAERNRQKIKVKDVAKAMNVTTKTVQNWELIGITDITILTKLANYFNCKREDFLVGI